ncbi:MAG: glutaredoxin [Candidatus Brocadiales bacterium]|nr:glutaredoxin [Candidatus Bathyanammoxibius sp.]MCQ4573946.1 glutaredoxin [Candidatus Bathyanammoxibius amoris]
MSQTGELLVFTQETCPNCDAAKKKLKDAGLEYKEICIDTVDGRAEFALQISGITTTPAFLYDGREYNKVEDILSQHGK